LKIYSREHDGRFHLSFQLYSSFDFSFRSSFSPKGKKGNS